MIDFSAIGGEAATATGAASSDRRQLGQEDFLRLMLAQLRHQDPLSPMKSGEFLTQIAQFTTATGVSKLQRAFDGFEDSMQAGQALRAATLVGREVLVASNTGHLPPDQPMTGSVQVPAAVDNLTITVRDSAGQVLRRIELGPQSAGSVPFAWDGRDADGERLPKGTYGVSAHTDIGGGPVALEVLSAAEVRSVLLTRGDQPPRLNLEGLGELSLAAVRQVM